MNDQRVYIETDAPGYVLDIRTNTVINTDTGSLLAYRAAVADHKKKAATDARLAALETDIQQIKQLLLQLVNGPSHG